MEGPPPRVVACVVGAQLLGAGIGFAVGGRFEFAWIGGAVATLPGLLLGRRLNKGSLGPKGGLLLAIAAVLAAFAGLFLIPRFLREAEAMASLKSLSPADLKRLEIRDLGRGGAKATLADAEVLTSFARACADAGPYSPNHPRYERKWHVVVGGPKPMELELYLEPRDPLRVFGAFVETSGSTTWFHGYFQSRALRPWVSRHLEKRD